MPTNGNAGAAWAVYAARAGLGALIAMPVDAPEITRRECVVAGAELLTAQLTDEKQIDAARAAQAGGPARIPNGRIVTGTGVNAGWSWHVEDVEFAEVARDFGLHELAVEDAVHAHQRAKLERYGDTLFCVLRPARYIDETETVKFGELEVITAVGTTIEVKLADGSVKKLAHKPK